MCAQPTRALQPPVRPPNHDHTCRAAGPRQLHLHQALRARADDRHRIAKLDRGIAHAVQRAGQRLDQRGLRERQRRRHAVHILRDDMRRHADVLSERAPVEAAIELLAQLLAAAPAVEAGVAGRRVGRSHRIARMPAGHACANRADQAGKLMAERHGWHEQPVAAQVALQVGAAC